MLQKLLETLEFLKNADLNYSKIYICPYKTSIRKGILLEIFDMAYLGSYRDGVNIGLVRPEDEPVPLPSEYEVVDYNYDGKWVTYIRISNA